MLHTSLKVHVVVSVTETQNCKTQLFVTVCGAHSMHASWVSVQSATPLVEFRAKHKTMQQ